MRLDAQIFLLMATTSNQWRAPLIYKLTGTLNLTVPFQGNHPYASFKITGGGIGRHA